jgi:hypothetical protein
MSVAAPPVLNQLATPPFPVRRFTVDEYHRMLQAGCLSEDDPVELLEGWIAAKMPRNPSHDSALSLVLHALETRVPAGWFVRAQSAITTGDSEPEPDFAMVRGTLRSYKQRHPVPGDIALVIEVSDASLSHDRAVKGRLYARAAIPVYWVINLVDSQVEVFHQPSGPTASPQFGRCTTYAQGQAVPLLVEGRDLGPIPVADLLP